MELRTKTGSGQMVRFRCEKCDRDLVWTTATALVQCPNCGKWVKAGTFWRPKTVRRKTENTVISEHGEQMELF